MEWIESSFWASIDTSVSHESQLLVARKEKKAKDAAATAAEAEDPAAPEKWSSCGDGQALEEWHAIPRRSSIFGVGIAAVSLAVWAREKTRTCAFWRKSAESSAPASCLHRVADDNRFCNLASIVEKRECLSYGIHRIASDRRRLLRKEVEEKTGTIANDGYRGSHQYE